MNYTRFLNKISLGRKPSPIRVLTAIVHQSPPSLISMAGGMPNTETFPLKSATFELTNGQKFNLTPGLMKQALQYGPTPGLPSLLEWIHGLQDLVHRPPLLHHHDHPSKVEFLVTNGSQDGICKALEALTSENDNVLMETPLYSGTLAVAKPLGINIIPIQTDKDGMDPDSLQNVLSRWKPSDAKDPNSDIPKLLYLIPNGGNPTGHSLTAKRKHRIYQLAREYDLLILEDDPYFYLQFQKPYFPSLLSMDEDGRVLRFDSFSKLISSGMRIGFTSGPRPILDRMALHMQASVMHASSMSQVVLMEILHKWGYAGFQRHAEEVADFYKKRRDQCIAAANKHLTGLAEWSEPSGGMFLWIKIPKVSDTYKMITVKAREKEVLFVPGNAFQVDDTQPSQYVRASYSTCKVEEMDMAFERLAALIREEQET